MFQDGIWQLFSIVFLQQQRLWEASPMLGQLLEGSGLVKGLQGSNSSTAGKGILWSKGEKREILPFAGSLI